MVCNRKEICFNYPNECGICNASSDVLNNYPCFQNKDKVEVVRCRDCKWCEITKYNDGEVEYGCDCVGGLNCAEADTFCSYGERR